MCIVSVDINGPREGLKLKKILFTAMFAVVILAGWEPLKNGLRRDMAFHALQDAGWRINDAIQRYPNDQFAILFACNATESPIRCDGESDGRAINVTYYTKQGEVQKVFARKRFGIELKPQLIYGVTEFP
ncbi:MAG: hypothetical protein CEO12_625 [Parcubacteria group bacterium Gr01-1014_46]|nr:MAG: hypothetical protein CEO12_625 [Parcubacteria group bacterium Gr01-1014_46]